MSAFSKASTRSPTRTGNGQPAGVPVLRQGPLGHGQAHGRSPAVRRVLLAHLLLAGSDPFGGRTMMRPWFEDGDPMALAELKLDIAFGFFERLGQPFFCFHDRDVAPEDVTPGGVQREPAGHHRQDGREDGATGTKLLWGTANLFSNRRSSGGAATNPDPEVFAYAAAQGQTGPGDHAPAGRRQLRAVGRPRGLGLPDQQPHGPGAGPAGPVP